MDLNKRINRLEEMAALSGVNLPYCVCEGDRPRYEVYQQKGSDSVPMRDGRPLEDKSEACTRCKKPIRRQVMIIDIIGTPFEEVAPGAATFRIETGRPEL
jgi:hypothetical protein